MLNLGNSIYIDTGSIAAIYPEGELYRLVLKQGQSFLITSEQLAIIEADAASIANRFSDIMHKVSPFWANSIKSEQ